jgi:transglutaminase-like putative cysteine protease
MVQVRTDDPTPPLLRLAVADKPIKEGFDSRPLSGGQRLATLGDYIVPQVDGISSRRHRAEIRALRLDMGLAPYYPQLIRMDGLPNSWRFDQPTGQVYSREPVLGHTYTVDYDYVTYSARALRNAAAIPPRDSVRDYATIEQIDEVTALASSLTAGLTNQYDIVRALHDYFSPENGFVYSLDAPAGDTGYPIVDFLTSTKQGFCVQYAAALTWLVRAMSYPARVAYGFTAGQNADGDDTRVLTSANLHAWTEVYFAGFGWVPFDATPSTSITGAVRMPWAPEPGEEDPGAEPTAAPGDDPSAGTGPTGPAGDPRDVDAGDQVNPGSQSMTGWWIGGAALLVVVVLALVAPSVRRRTLRRARLARSGALVVLDAGGPRPAAPNEFALVTGEEAILAARRDAHQAWAELIDTMLDYGVPVDESETPRTTGDRVGHLAGLPADTAGHVDLLARAEERARYARTPLRPDALDQAVRTTRAALHERATRWEQVRAVFMPASVLLRWRLGWITWVNRSISLAARVRALVAHVSPRRLLAR